MSTSVKTPAPFVLDPTLPWLFNDPQMQEPAAFHGMRTLELSSEPWEPMALYFPASSTLAMRRVTNLSQLTVGAAYVSEMDYFDDSTKKRVTSCCLGRYVGLTYADTLSAKRQWKKGAAHITLEADVLDCDLRTHYHFHEDGTRARFVDTKHSTHRLYQITHYVNLPAAQLTSLGVEAVKSTGLTLRQAVWLKQEQEMNKNRRMVEFTTHMTGGLNLPDYRVVANRDTLEPLFNIWGSLPILTPGEARRCKSGTLAISTRSINYDGLEFSYTEHYRLADAAVLLDWFRTHSDLQRQKVDAAIASQQIEHRFEALRAERAAEEAKQKAKQAREIADDKRPLGVCHAYAGLEELASAA